MLELPCPAASDTGQATHAGARPVGSSSASIGGARGDGDAGSGGGTQQPVGGSSGLAGSPGRAARCGTPSAGNGGEQGPGVGVDGLRHRSRPPVPTSTIRPRYITAMRSATMRAAARSWVTNSTAMPELAPEPADQVEDGGRQRHVEGAGRLVAEQHLGRARPWPGPAPPAGAGRRRAAPAWPAATSAGRPTRARASATRGPALVPAQPFAAQSLADQLADGQPRGQRGAGVLEHHLRTAAPGRARSCPRRSAAGRRSSAAASTCRSRSRRRGRPPRPRRLRGRRPAGRAASAA